MLKEWIEAQIKAFIRKQMTEENITSVLASVLDRLHKRVQATDTKIDDYAWYIANSLLTDPVIVHELYTLIQDGIVETPEIIDVEVAE